MFQAAIIQMSSENKLSANVKFLKSMLHEAAGLGASYVQTPEMTGLVEKNKENFFKEIKQERDDEIVILAQDLAKELDIFIHIGSTPILLGSDKSSKFAANRAFLFSPKGLVAKYDKLHMFDVCLDGGETWQESAVYRAGKQAVVAEMLETKIGFSICYDLRFPHLYRHLAKNGAAILAAPSCFTKQTGKAHWHILNRARAIENGAYIISAAQVGRHKDGRETYGHSLIINPWGKIIAEIEKNEPAIATATINVLESQQARQKIPNLKIGAELTNC